MLIHEPPPPERHGRAPVDPNWPLWGWLALAGLLGFGAAHAAGIVGYLLICASFAAVCRAVTELVGYGRGLREWRQ